MSKKHHDKHSGQPTQSTHSTQQDKTMSRPGQPMTPSTQTQMHGSTPTKGGTPVATKMNPHTTFKTGCDTKGQKPQGSSSQPCSKSNEHCGNKFKK